MEFKQWVENRYRHPVVLVFASPMTEQACRRNGMDLVQMLRPFSVHPTELFAHIGDRADTIQVRKFGVRFTRLECVREVEALQSARYFRHLLRDHVAMELAYGEQLDRAMSSLLKENGGVVEEPRLSAQVASQLLERSHPAWYSQFIRDYAYVVRCSHFDTIDHPVGCIYAASTREEGGIDGIMRQFREQQKQPADTRRNMPCMDDELHSYFLLVHDITEGPPIEEVRRMLAAVKAQYGHAHCAVVKINSVVNPQDVKNMDPSLWIDANRLALDVPSRSAVHLAQPSQQTNQMSSPGDGVVRANNNVNNSSSSSGGGGDGGGGGEQKPVSGSSNATVNVVLTAENSSYPNSENSSSTPASLHFPRVHTMFGKWPNGMAKITGCHMSPEDVEGLRDVVTYYLSRCLFNFLERKLRVLVLTINEKRTTTFGKVAAWFRNKDEVKPKTDSWVASHDGSPTKYLAGSLEMQMRRAADILLALADYDSAISYYRMCRNELLSTVSLREFNKPLIAACQEGIGVCEFLQGRLPLPSLAPWMTGGTSSKNSGDCRLEVAQNDYVECRVHTYAFRLSLMLYEYSRTRSPPALDRAVASLIHVQRVGIAYRNKLYSAILHELLASVSLFLNPPQPSGMTIPALLPNNFLLRSHVRQYARQMIIAGSAYLDDNLIENALRCYLRALRVCGGVGRRGSWQLIFEHIHTLLAHMYRKIGNQIRGMVMASIAVSMATPMYSNLRTGLRNFESFWSRQRQVMENLGYKLCPHMVAPCILPESIRVSTNAFHCDEVTRQESQVVSDELAEVEWHKMEDKLRQHYTGYASSSPRHQLNFREEIRKTQRDNAVVCMRRYSMHLTEPLEITVTLRNPIGGPLTAEKLCLLYVAKQKPDQLWKSASSQTVELQASESKSVTISFSPSEEGTYVIIGFCWTLMELEGYYYFATETYKASDDGGSDNRIGAFEYAVEHPVPNVNSPANMEIEVAPPQAWITARLDPELPPFMRDGEYCQTTLVLTNGSSYRTARRITLQRSPKNAHVVWMEPFGLERNIDAEATFVLEQELAPKTSLTLPMTVQAHHSQDSSSRCKNNFFFLVGYISGTAKEEDALPSFSSSSFLASLRFHRFFRRVVVKSAILLSSMVLPPANVTMATAVLITASNVSEAREPPVRVSRVMVIHRPRWRVVPTSLGNLLAENALDCILSSGGALCVPLSVVSETPSSKTTHTDATVVHSRKLIEEVCIPLSSTLAATSRRIMVEENIGAGVVDSEMNSYFMRCSFRGPGTIGEVKVPEGLPFYLDKAGAAGKSAGSDEGAAQKQEEQIYHPHHQQPQRHSTMVVPVVEPFTPICVAVVWAVEERGRMYSGQMFHFVDPVRFLSSCEFSVGEAHDRLQEHLCDSMIKDRTLHPHHGAMFYHVEVPHTVETTADNPDVAIIPVTVHCRSLAAHPLLVTVKTTMPGSPDALASPMLSPVPLTFVGKTSVGFLLLPHETHLLNFTACAFAPGVAECNHFQVSAVALKPPQGETCGSWRTGTSQSALMKLLGENTSCLGRSPSMTAGVRGGEINVSGGDGNKCVSSGGKDHLGGVGDLVRDGVQTVILGHGMAAITRVLFVPLSAETRRAAAEAVAARARAYQEDAKIYEKQYREFEHRRALLNSSSGTTLQKADDLLVLYPPRARKLVEGTQDTPNGAAIAASIGSVGQPDPSPWHGDREILRGIVGSTSAVMLEAVGTTSSLVTDEVVEVVADVEGQENQEGLQNVAVPLEDTSKSGTDVSCSSTTSTDMSVESAAEQNPNTSSEEVYHTTQQQ